MSFLGGQLFHHLMPLHRFAAWSYLQHSEQLGFQSRPAASVTWGREHLDGHLVGMIPVEHMKHGQQQHHEQRQQQEGWQMRAVFLEPQ